MNIQLLKVTIKNFRSIKFAELDLNRNGMVQVQGRSGHGKSSIFWAISYAFGFCPGPQVQLPSWGSKTPMSVDVEFLLNNEKCWVHRGTDFVGCSGPGDYSAIHGASSVNSRLQTLLGITPEMVSLLTYRPQQEIGSFIRKTDAEKKEFLTKILRLDKFEEALEVSAVAAKALEPKSNLAWNTARALEQAIEEAQGNLLDLEDNTRVKEIVPLQNQIKRLAEEEVSLSKKIQDELSDNTSIASKKQEIESLSHQLDQALVADESAATEFALERRRLQKQINSLINKKTGWSQNKDKYIVLEKQLNVAKSGKCPTCGSKTQDNQIIQKIENDQNNLEKFSVEFTDEDEKLLKILEEQLLTPRKLSTTVDEIRKYMTKVQGEVTTDTLRKESFVKEQKLELQKIKSDLQNMKKDLSNLEFIKHQTDKTKEQIAEKEAQLLKHKNDLADIEKRMATERDFSALVGNKGFLGLIFDEILQDIADTTNLMLGKIPNTANVTVQFRTDNITQKGTVKRSIVPVVSVSGNEGPLDIVLSGGMKTVVALAIDLSISQVAARRAGVNMGWLMLDEVFDGCDSKTRESMLELLAFQSKDKLILVVDHAVDTADLFADKINVELINGETIIGV